MRWSERALVQPAHGGPVVGMMPSLVLVSYKAGNDGLYRELTTSWQNPQISPLSQGGLWGIPCVLSSDSVASPMQSDLSTDGRRRNQG